MILSFPIDAWLLLVVAVGIGLGLEVAFYRRHRRAAPPERGAATGDVPTPGNDT